MAWAVDQPVKGLGKLVLLLLANYASNKEGLCFPNQNEIAEQCGITDRAVRTWLKKLEAEGYISRTKRQRVDGSRTSDLISINLRKTSPELGSGRTQSNRNETTIQPERRSYPKNKPITEPITKRLSSNRWEGLSEALGSTIKELHRPSRDRRTKAA